MVRLRKENAELVQAKAILRIVYFTRARSDPASFAGTPTTTAAWPAAAGRVVGRDQEWIVVGVDPHKKQTHTRAALESASGELPVVLQALT